MKYFIYPKAINGLSIADFLDIYFHGNQYYFIDDGDEAIALNSISKYIYPDDIVLVASTKNYENIVRKLQERNLCYMDGVSWCGKIINQLINKQKEFGKKYVGIVISSHYIENNFANIDENLQQMGCGVIYFVFDKQLYEKYSSKGFCVLAPHSILEKIDSVDLMVLANGEATHSNVISVNLTHGFQGRSHAYFYREDGEVSRMLSVLDYEVSGSKNIKAFNERYYKKYGAKTEALPLGYLKLDNDYKKYKKYLDTHFRDGLNCGEFVVLSFTFMNKEHNIEKYRMLAKMLKDKKRKVVISPHPTHYENVMQKLTDLFDNQYIFFGNKFENRWEMFARSSCLVTDCSSVGYTYPIITGKPVVIFARDSQEYFKKAGNNGYFDERIHFFCSTEDELCQIIERIPNISKEYVKVIENYRKDECFNFGCSEKKITDWIVKKLRGNTQ